MTKRKFNGIYFDFSGSYPTKSQAIGEAKYKRDRGFNARVVTVRSGSAVYVH